MHRTSLYFTLVGLSLMLSAESVQAQAVVWDGSLNTRVTRSGDVFTIDDGTTAGTNLFHSFREFSIPRGGSAIFNNARNIQNIFSRVTGGTVSNIDGSIQAQDGANLFLLNPAGILFGANASLNIGGSFVGTTANSIKFADGMEFSATNLNDRPLLTMSAPIGVQLGQNPGAIALQGTGHTLTSAGSALVYPFLPTGAHTGLAVQPGKTLALIGGKITLQDGILTAPAGRVELGSLTSGTVHLTSSPELQFDYQGLSNFEDIQLTGRSLVDVNAINTGSIQVQGRHISLSDGSLLWSQNLGAQPPGSIRVHAANRLTLSGTTNDAQIPSSIVTSALGTGASGNLLITTPHLVLESGGNLSSRAYRTASGGDLEIQAGTIEISGYSPFSPEIVSASGTTSIGSGKAGNVLVTAENLVIREGGLLGTSTFLTGTGGNVTVNISNAVQLFGVATANRSTRSSIINLVYGSGQGGDISISTGQLRILDGAIVSSSTFDQGDGGNVTIAATHSIELIGAEPSLLLPSAIGNATLNAGDAGDVTIKTPRLILRDGGRVDASTVATGDGGNVTVEASELVEVTGVLPGSRNPSLLTSSANILDPVLQALYNLPAVPSGSSGNVTIKTRELRVTNGGLVSVQNEGAGNAGIAKIEADRVLLSDRGAIKASTSSGEGGNISIRSDLLQLRQNSVISATADGGEGTGGNIKIHAPIIVGLENSDIIANAFWGAGGNISITTQGIIGLAFRDTLTPKADPTNDISASSQSNVDGSVQVNNVGVDPNSGLIELSTDLMSNNQQMAAACNSHQGSRFVITGHGGMPQNPNNLTLPRPWSDLRVVSSTIRAERTSAGTATNAPSVQPLREATSWHRNPRTSKVELIAERFVRSTQPVTCR